jgi:LysR family transcriptional regulator, cyn operon transcriptional activator
MELNHLRYFFEVAKSGSFTEAARRLHVSQSALSKAVATLEESEGVKLFERTKRGVSLTSLGSAVYAKSEQLFQTFSDIENTCRGTKEVCEGPLRFGASDHVSNYLLVDKLQQLRKQHPNVKPSLFSGTPNTIVGGILSNELEFGLFFTKINVPGITYEDVASVDMAIVCAPSLLSEDEAESTPAKLKGILRKIGFIGSIGSDYQHHPSEDFLKLMGDKPNIAFEASSQETQKRLCLRGGGVAFLARFMVEKEIKSGSLIEIPVSRPLKLNLVLARRTSRALNLNARTFLELLGPIQA